MSTRFQRPTDLAEERSTYPVVVAFLDEEGNSTVPNALTWSLLKGNGEIVNERDQITITPGQEVTVILSGDDLAVVRGETRRRTLLMEGTYNSNLGNDLPIRDSVIFTIKDLKGVS